MSEEKVYSLLDEEGNSYNVKDWEGLFDSITRTELEDIYVVTKYMYSIEEEMIELEEIDILKTINRDDVPLEDIANSLDKITEEIGIKRAKVLDVRVKVLLAKKGDNIDPFSIIHLN